MTEEDSAVALSIRGTSYDIEIKFMSAGRIVRGEHY